MAAQAQRQECGARWRGGPVTDRAHRYRAQACAPPGPRRCALCGSTRFLTVDHRDGDEHNDARGNLRWLCKSCNTRRGLAMAARGQGRRTAQYNPVSNVPLRMGTLEYEALQKANMRRMDRLLNKYNAILGDGGDDAHLKGQIDRLHAAMDDLYARYRGQASGSSNPPASGAASLGEYVSALRILHGEIAGDFGKARAVIHATPFSTRSSFAREIWRRRRRSYASDSALIRALMGGG